MMRPVSILGSVLALGVLAGCASDPDEPLVAAAASLSPAIDEILEQEFPDRDGEDKPEINVTYDGSAALLDQLREGLPADVFITADKATMDRAVVAGVIAGKPKVFAKNTLQLVTPAGNPGSVTGFNNSLRGVDVVTCAPEVPCGRLTEELIEEHGLKFAAVSEETSVTDVLGKVTSGEADAGLVYETDARKVGGQVEVFDIPGARDHPNEYFAAPVSGGDHDLAHELIEVLEESGGQEVLCRYGFEAP